MTQQPGVELVLGGQFYLAHRHARAATNRQLKDHQLDLRHLGVLQDLQVHGPSKQRELGDRIQMDKSSLVYVIDELERQGLAVRQRDEHDRRSHAVALTAKGRRVLTRATATAELAMRQLLDPLSAREKQELSRLLGKLLAAIGDH
jgi:DNA-binding MarR family transcriptional regulator